MADDYNNNVTDQQTKTHTNQDEVVDEIPVNAKNINENTTQQNSSVNNFSGSSENSLTGIISLALGIFSVICCCTFIPSVISAIVGLVLGIISFKDKNTGNKTFAVIGIILCSIGLAIFLITVAACILMGSFSAAFEIPATMHSGMM